MAVSNLRKYSQMRKKDRHLCVYFRVLMSRDPIYTVTAPVLYADVCIRAAQKDVWRVARQGERGGLNPGAVEGRASGGFTAGMDS